MKIIRWLVGMAVIALGIMAGSIYAAGEVSDSAPCYVVKMTDFARKVEAVKMSEAEYKTLEDRLELEKKNYSEAITKASKEWNTDEKNKGTVFPEYALNPRSILITQKFDTLEKATMELSGLIRDEEKRKEMESKRERNNFRRQRDYKAESEKIEKKDKIIERAGKLVEDEMNKIIGAEKRLNR